MSSRCQCPFSGPADTILGCHRDPISSEKGWLDFAVRELSRVAAGKARGQEAVWRGQCKPAWWDSVCAHPWKNPTANPKDCKDTLKDKFQCLVQHLRDQGQFPREMEEEVALWEAGRKAEVFLMTSFSSLLGQASSVHALLDDTLGKMQEAGSSVDSSILDHLHRCLTACLSRIAAIRNDPLKADLKVGPTPCAGKKRRAGSDSESDGPSHPPSKRLKHFPLPSSTLSASASSSASPPPPPLSLATSVSLAFSNVHSASSASSMPHSPSPFLVSNSLTNLDSSKMLLAVLQRQLLQKQAAGKSGAPPLVCKNSKSQPMLKPVRQVMHGHRVRGEKRRRVRGVSEVAAVDGSVCPSLSVCLPVTVSEPSVRSAVETTEFTDFLELQLESNDDVSDCQFLNDCQFLDSLLRETTPEISVNVSSIPSPVSVSQPVGQSGPCSRPVADSNLINHPHHVPLTSQSHSPSTKVSESAPSDSSPISGDVGPMTVADTWADNVWTDRVVDPSLDSALGGSGVGEGLVGIEGDPVVSCLTLGVGGMVDTEVVSDSGYHSECSGGASSLGSSLDSEQEGSSCSDLDSPDLEAYLDALDVGTFRKK